jgi:uncharacterized membrane protein
MFAIAVVALFSVASNLSSLATYFGLLTAGMAVALQNVILASLGYLVLMGKRGIRIVIEYKCPALRDVINMGMLQFQLREFDVEEEAVSRVTSRLFRILWFSCLPQLAC